MAGRFSPRIAARSSLASVGKLMASGCTVVSTVTQAKSLPRKGAGLVYQPQTLGQQQFEFVAELIAPVAQAASLLWKAMLEELLACKVLEIPVVDPALAHRLIG